MALKYPQLGSFTLYGSGNVIGDTTLVITSLKSIDNVQLAMTDFGDKGFMTLDPGAGALEEQISFTGVTANANGTSTLTGVKTVLLLSPYTETSGLAKQHSGGSTAVVAVTSGMLNTFANLTDNETVTGVWTFNELPTLDTYEAPTNNAQFAAKKYVDDVAAGGTVTVNKVLIAATAGETVAAGNLLYLKSADGYWWKTDADTASTCENVQLAIAQGAGTAGNPISGGVLTVGVDANQSGMTIGATQYVSNTAGAISSSAGTNEVTVGTAKSATELYFNPRFNQQLTEDQQDALAGSSGTPSATNVFVTANDNARNYGTQAYYATATGNDTYVITPSPAVAAYANGLTLRVKLDVANTGPATLNVNGLGAIALVKGVATALVTGDLVANQIITVVYNSTGTVFQIVQAPVLLTDGSTLTDQHFHKTTYTIGSRDVSAANGAVTYAHGLGVIPKWLKVYGTYVGGSGTSMGTMVGTFDGTNTKSIITMWDATQTFQSGSDTTDLVAGTLSVGNSYVATAAMDATNITLTWTKTGSPTGIQTMLFETSV